MFLDKARVHVKAGNGGDGIVSFHTEKNVPNGGPDGGDGGRGGDIVFYVDPGLNTLQQFRYKRRFFAPNGANGGNHRQTGRSGKDLRIAVPPGTIVRDAESGQLLADLTDSGQETVIVHGGRGGQGNIHFVNSIRQAPKFARAGEAGEEYDLNIELKLIADVGLIGLPNAGKSTLISVISAARPKIADYPFTTLEPNLGVVSVGDFSFVAADIPGLIEGAHEGQGLGHDFLRHIERTRLFLHVIDASGYYGSDPIADYHKINRELESYSITLKDRPQIIVLSKIDLVTKDKIEALANEFRNMNLEVYPVSAPTHQGISELLNHIASVVKQLPKTILSEPVQEKMHYRYQPENLFTVEKQENIFTVQGDWVINLVNSTNFDDNESIQYFQRIIRRKGIIEALEKAGIQEGDLVRMHDLEFEFIR